MPEFEILPTCCTIYNTETGEAVLRDENPRIFSTSRECSFSMNIDRTNDIKLRLLPLGMFKSSMGKVMIDSYLQNTSRLSQKRFRKLLIGVGFSRNNADIIVHNLKVLRENQFVVPSYSSLWDTIVEFMIDGMETVFNEFWNG